jgi:hypothetical protein
MFTKNFLLVGVISSALLGVFGAVDAGKAKAVRRHRIASIDWPAQQRWAERFGPHATTARSDALVRRRPFKNRVGAETVATQYLNVYAYEDTSCSTPELIFSVGTGICVAVSDASNDASSYMYSYNGTANIVYMNYYSDSACTTFIQDTVSYNMNLVGAEDTCQRFGSTSGKYSIDDALFSFPNSDGLYEQ